MARKPLVFVLLLALVAAASAAYGQTLTPGDRDRAVKHLEGTRKAFLEATRGLSEKQWSFKPGPERWSVAEVAEHIALSEDFLYKLISEQVMKAPPRVNSNEDVRAVDDWVLQRIPDRSNKAQAPEQLVPKARWIPSETVQHFQESRANTLRFLENTPDLRAHAIDSAGLGKTLDAYQWVLFLSAHTERHIAQIKEVKADPNFPKE